MNINAVDNSDLIAIIADNLSSRGMINSYEDYERELYEEIVHLLGGHTKRAIEAGSHSFVLVEKNTYIHRAIRAMESIGYNLDGSFLSDDEMFEDDDEAEEHWEFFTRLLNRAIPAKGYVAFPVNERL